MSSRGDLALSVRGLSKSYSIAKTAARPAGIAEALATRARRPFARAAREDFHALTDVSFDVEAGQAVGIIGRNGAGKSTLLKILSRITEPTSGRVELFGRVGSLLEVGTGFHPELTGRENIFLNGAMLAMKRREIVRQFDSIVDFAGVEQFLDTPVKRYSSGMYVRLAFAVAAHLDPEILVVDEVLAVGDAQFQKKCLGRLNEVSREQGRTVLFVSHNMAAIEALCTRCVYLDAGRVVLDGDTGDALDRYLSGASRGVHESVGVFDLGSVPRTEPGTHAVFRRVELRRVSGEPTDTIRMGEGLVVAIDVPGLSLPRQLVYVRVATEAGITLFTVVTAMKRLDFLRNGIEQDHVILTIPKLVLSPARYLIEVSLLEGLKGSRRVIDRVERAAEFEVSMSDVYGNGYNFAPSGPTGVIFTDMHWEVRADGVLVAESASSDEQGSAAVRRALPGR